MIASDVSKYITDESNKRFTKAVEEGVALNDMFFGDDCFPAWVDMPQDEAERNYHVNIQDRLLDIDITSRLGNFIRERLIDTCNIKLEQARLLGLATADIKMGKGLLPVWDQSAVDASIPLSAQPVENHWEDSPERNILTFGAASLRGYAGSMASEDDTTGLFKESSHSDSSATSNSDSCSSSDVSGDDKNEVGDVDDRYAMFSGGDPQPLPSRYSESDGEAAHILFDVEIVGGPNGTYEVDMEVYQAESDSDVDELPEVELAVDATHYEFFFSTGDAVDANLPGMNLECTLEGPDTEAEYPRDVDGWGDEDLQFDSEEEGGQFEEEDDMLVDEEEDQNEDVMMEF